MARLSAAQLQVPGDAAGHNREDKISTTVLPAAKSSSIGARFSAVTGALPGFAPDGGASAGHGAVLRPPGADAAMIDWGVGEGRSEAAWPQARQAAGRSRQGDGVGSMVDALFPQKRGPGRVRKPRKGALSGLQGRNCTIVLDSWRLFF